MNSTLVIQSHRQPLPSSWLNLCLQSVREWSRIKGYEYRFIDDRIFELIPTDIRAAFAQRPVILSDLARLLAIRTGLNEQCETVLWLDADFFIFAPQRFELPSASYALGRENWVQLDRAGQVTTYRKVHNAALLFRHDNSFLDFYIETAQKLLRETGTTVPNQFIGPKLLSALHNICQFPVMERAEMLSPLVQRDLLSGGGDALDRFRKVADPEVAGVNLCSSLCGESGSGDEDMPRLMQILAQGAIGTDGSA
jgi:hypothetical protein